MISVLIAAGGKGTRMGAAENKVFLMLNNKEIIAHTMQCFQNHPQIDEIIVVSGKDEHQKIADIADKYKISKFRASTTGGETRQISVYNGLSFVSGDIVLIHDAARALITQDEITRVINDVTEHGAAAVGVKCKDTLKVTDESGFIISTPDREMMYQIQTPQAFKTKDIINAHKAAREQNFSATDDCMVASLIGIKVKITHGSYENIKITTPEDIIIAKEILQKRS